LTQISSTIGKVNPFLFFLIREGKIIAWDYKSHQQYELEKDYFVRLLELSHGSVIDRIIIDNELE